MSQPTTTATRESEVRVQLSIMESDLKMLSENLSELEARLSSVLHSVPLEAENKQSKDMALVPLASELNNKNCLIEKATANVRRMVEQLEL